MTAIMTPTEKLKIFTKTIITINYKWHDMYDTFLDEWEFKIDTDTKSINELYLFDSNQNIIITHIFESKLQRKYYDYFVAIGIVD